MGVLMVVRPARGGMRQHLLTLVGGLRGRGVTVDVAGPSSEPIMAELAALGCSVWDIPMAAELNPGQDIVAAQRLRSLLKRKGKDYDVVHVHGFKASLPGRCAAALCGKPVVYTVHNFVLGAAGGLKRRIYLSFERTLAPVTKRYIAVSQALKDDLVQKAGLPAARIAVVYNGITPAPPVTPAALAELRREFGLADEERVILCVARLVPEKGVDVLIAAAAHLGKLHPALRFRVVVAGDGPAEGELRRMTNDMNLAAQVTLAGHRTDVPALMALSSVVAFPSRAEGLSISLIEAAAAGKALVASAAGGMVELIEDGHTGLLVPPDDPDSLAAALARVLDDQRLASALGTAAQASAARFTPSAMLDATLAVYREAAGHAV